MSVFDILCPCHAQLSQTGHILHLGPTLAKLLGDPQALPVRFLELFELRRPHPAATMKVLFALAGQKLTFRLRAAPHTELKAVLALLPDGQGAVVNFSFGIAIQNAVQRHSLTHSDFASTDLAIEMLYLMEAKNAAMEASRTLNQRLQGAKIAAEEQAFTDTLTGLKNRRALNLVLGRLSEAKVPFTVMQLDLDYFKAVNDSYGHAAGDHVLQVAARILVEETRAEDTVVRLGGDEFALVFYNVINPTRLAKLSQRIIKRLEQPVPFQNNICRISGSIGIALFDRRSEATPEVMLEQSDQALYASKKAGRAQHSFFHCGAA